MIPTCLSNSTKDYISKMTTCPSRKRAMSHDYDYAVEGNRECIERMQRGDMR